MNRLYVTGKKKQLRLLRKLDKARGAEPPQVVFLHIPKCAGSSVNLHFKANITRNIFLNSFIGDAYEAANIQRAQKAEFVGGHFGFDTLQQVRQQENSFAFVFLREPIARLKSLYFFCRTLPLEDNIFSLSCKLAREMSFIDFCLSSNPIIRAFTDNAQARTLAQDYTLMPDAWDSEEALVSQAKQHLRLLDYIGFTETISADLKVLAARTQTRIVSETMKKNETKSREYEVAKEHFSADLATEKEQLEPLIRLDQQIYDYAKALKD